MGTIMLEYLKRTFLIFCIKYAIAYGNWTIIDAATARIPPRRAGYKLHGYIIEWGGSWTQHVIITQLNPNVRFEGTAAAIASALKCMGFTTKPVTFNYKINLGDSPVPMGYEVMSR